MRTQPAWRTAIAGLALVAAVVGMLATDRTVAQELWPTLNDAEVHPGVVTEALRRAPDRFGGRAAEAAGLIRDAMLEIE